LSLHLISFVDLKCSLQSYFESNSYSTLSCSQITNVFNIQQFLELPELHNRNYPESHNKGTNTAFTHSKSPSMALMKGDGQCLRWQHNTSALNFNPQLGLLMMAVMHL